MRQVAKTSIKARSRSREKPLQQRTIVTRHKILTAAVTEFAKNGYEGTSTRVIATKARVKHPLLTYHFQNKEKLWQTAITSILTNYRSAFDSRLEGLRGVDETTTLRLISEEFIRFSANNVNFHRIMAHVAFTQSKRLDWLVNEHLRHIFDKRAVLIRAAQKAGCYIHGDPYHLDYVFVGAATRIFMLSGEVEKMMRKSPFNSDVVDEHVRICLSLFFRT